MIVGLFADGMSRTLARRSAMKKRYIVTLTEEERGLLQKMVSRGKAAARKLMHARILLKADASPGGPDWSDARIAEGLEIGRATVERVRKAFVEEGLEAALAPRKSRRQYRRKLDGDGEAYLVALACSQAPEGRSRWTLRLLADRMVQLEVVDHLSHETVRQVLKKRTQAMVEQTVVHSAAGECRIRLEDGRRAGGVQAAVRSEAAGGVPG
jgi:transposase